MAFVATDGKAKAPRIGSSLAHVFLKKSLLFKISSFIVYLIMPINVPHAEPNTNVVVPDIENLRLFLIIYNLYRCSCCSFDRRSLIRSVIGTNEMICLRKRFGRRIVVIYIILNSSRKLFLPRSIVVDSKTIIDITPTVTQT